ncbi:MAG: hypothetical protein ACJAUG_002270, partial [Halioglobus sp.]
KPENSTLQATELPEAKREILKLKSDLNRTEVERDILKKAAVDSIGHCNRHCKIPNRRGLKADIHLLLQHPGQQLAIGNDIWWKSVAFICVHVLILSISASYVGNTI